MPKATKTKKVTKKGKAAAKQPLKLKLPARKPPASIQVAELEEEEESSDSSQSSTEDEDNEDNDEEEDNEDVPMQDQQQEEEESEVAEPPLKKRKRSAVNKKSNFYLGLSRILTDSDSDSARKNSSYYREL
jgi:hypothetical protein